MVTYQPSSLTFQSRTVTKILKKGCLNPWPGIQHYVLRPLLTYTPVTPAALPSNTTSVPMLSKNLFQPMYCMEVFQMKIYLTFFTVQMIKGWHTSVVSKKIGQLARVILGTRKRSCMKTAMAQGPMVGNVMLLAVKRKVILGPT